MTKTYAVIAAGALLGGTVWFGTAAAVEAVSGTYNRPSIYSPPVASGCRTLTFNLTGKKVQLDSNLNAWGANINIRPNANCNKNEWNHVTQLVSTCWDGYSRNESKVGWSGNDADILHDCSARFGGRYSMWQAYVY